ncbi:hypothetical protein EV385_4310 [Krasilnikovia cinnamomea]|uniref:Uncharacterized protein n=1 Tax=Krasilnikovia cinnamomea TaxID=349313 RepID=A0A4Q7ZN56_9ACTN|nr:hypothetical protein EV385_4310 [Krasilnikovia cinnamomea]
MTTNNERPPAIGDPDPDDLDDDFAAEHADTVVDREIAGGDQPGETESPQGWSGLESAGPP